MQPGGDEGRRLGGVPGDRVARAREANRLASLTARLAARGASRRNTPPRPSPTPSPPFAGGRHGRGLVERCVEGAVVDLGGQIRRLSKQLLHRERAKARGEDVLADAGRAWHHQREPPGLRDPVETARGHWRGGNGPGWIAREDTAIDNACYAAGRSRVLRAFLERSSIYATRRGKRLWEAHAR